MQDQAGTVGFPTPAHEFRLVSIPEMKYDALAEPPRGEVCIRGNLVFSGSASNCAPLLLSQSPHPDSLSPTEGFNGMVIALAKLGMKSWNSIGPGTTCRWRETLILT